MTGIMSKLGFGVSSTRVRNRLRKRRSSFTAASPLDSFKLSQYYTQAKLIADNTGPCKILMKDGKPVPPQEQYQK